MSSAAQAITPGRAAPVTAGDGRLRQVAVLRACTGGALVVLLCIWHVRATKVVDLEGWVLLAGVVFTCIAFGRVFVRATGSLLSTIPGMPFVLLTGFFCANTLLFVLTLVSPLGMAANLGLVAVLAVVLLPVGRWPPASRATEACGLATMVFCGIAASLWVGDQQPILAEQGGRAVFQVWHDVFIHVRQISVFAHAHGFASMSDIRMSGAAAPIYHFASYMVPAALNAVTDTTAMQAYGGFQLPFGLLLAAFAAFALAQVLFGRPGPALLAAVAITAFPDSFQQGFAVRFLSYHFMTQVNLGMLYGIACIALAWIFMIEACRRERWTGIAISWTLLAVCMTVKAHLFVANAFLLLLYPCFLFGRHPVRRRLLFAGIAFIVFYSVVAISQFSTRVPTLRVDGSGIDFYFEILRWTFEPGRFHRLFDRFWYHPRMFDVGRGVLVAGLILVATFGYWLIAAPPVVWKLREKPDRFALAFAGMVVFNYMAMALLLALDDTGVGGPEEFVNRPHAWAYFVAVVFVAGCLWRLGAEILPRGRATGVALGAVAGVTGVALLGFVHVASRNLQTIPTWENYVTYDQNNGMSACLVKAADYIRTHGSVADVMQDSRFDKRFITTALAERQSYAAASTFAGKTPVLDARVDALRALQAGGDDGALRRYAIDHGIDWYLAHPEDSANWPARFLASAAYECDGYRVFRLGR